MIAFAERCPVSSNSAADVLCRMWNKKSAVPAREDNFAVGFGLLGSWRTH